MTPLTKIDFPSAEFNILIVDDDKDLSDNLSDILGEEGFKPFVARDGKTALECARVSPIDLVLVDMRLPDMSGMDLVDELSRISPQSDYIIITGYASLESAVEAVRQKHILAYETKPVEIERLLALIREVAKRRCLEREVLGVAEEERRRIGQELHDGLGQLLTGSALQAQFLAERFKESDGVEAEVAARLASLVNQAIMESSRLARGLAPMSLETNGLVIALEELVWQAFQSSGIECLLEIDPDVTLPEGPFAIHLYRIVQEAIQNALKHSGAGQVRICLTPHEGGSLLEVTDNGRGISADAEKARGMGLKIMNYRATLLGGSLDIGPNDGQGTRARFHFRALRN